MEILQYLAELLQNRKQVGIPGLGTIYKTKSPGRYDEKTHSFLPPSYTLQFSTDMLESEALAQYISSRRNISIDSANYFIEQFSDKAVQELSETNETQLGEIGKLSTVDGNIIFEPGASAVVGFEYFGLPEVKEEELIVEQPVEEAAAEENSAEDAAQEEAAPEKDIDEEDHTQDTEQHLIQEQILIEQVEDEAIDEEESTEDEIPKEIVTAPENTVVPVIQIEQPEDDFIDDPDAIEEKEPAPVEEEVTRAEEDVVAEEDVAVKGAPAEEYTALIEEETTPVEETPEVDTPAEESLVLDQESTTPAEENESIKIDPEKEATAEEKVAEVVEENKLEEENPGDERPEIPTFFPKEINPYKADYAAYPEDNVEENKKPLLLKIIFISIIILALLVAAYFLYPKLINPNTEIVEQSVPLDSMDYSNDPYAADSVYLDSLERAAIATDTTVTDTVTTPAVTTPTVAPTKPAVQTEPVKPVAAPVVKKEAVTTYEIIIGSLANRKEADKFIIQMKNKGIKAKIVDTLAKKWLKVSIASYTNHEQAIIERRRLVKELKDPEIYIYTNKPKK
jgi:hypothetical protein